MQHTNDFYSFDDFTKGTVVVCCNYGEQFFGYVSKKTDEYVVIKWEPNQEKVLFGKQEFDNKGANFIKAKDLDKYAEQDWFRNN